MLKIQESDRPRERPVITLDENGEIAKIKYDGIKVLYERTEDEVDCRIIMDGSKVRKVKTLGLFTILQRTSDSQMFIACECLYIHVCEPIKAPDGTYYHFVQEVPTANMYVMCEQGPTLYKLGAL